MARIWLVTGSSRGLGRTIIEAALESGDSVVATARKPEQLNDFVDTYGADRVLPLALDVSDNEQILSVVKAAILKFGRLDIVVNNAGYADLASIEDATLESFRAQFETNFFGVVNVTKAVLPTLRSQGSGHIFQISSLGGRLGSPGLASYQSAKWAVGGFSTVLAKEVAPFGIKVTVIEPGAVATDWAGSSMGIGHISEPYQQTVAKFHEARVTKVTTGSPPEKLAKAIVHISRVPDPPLRLLLGPDTVELAKSVSKEVAGSDKKWFNVTMLSI